MAVNKDMFHAQTTPSNQLFNTACKVLDGVSKLKERNAELEKMVEELKYTVATLETDLAMAQSWRTTTPPVGVCLFAATAIGGNKLSENVKALIPFMIALFSVLFLVTYVPAVSVGVMRLFTGG